jgi:hypothetical protein
MKKKMSWDDIPSLDLSIGQDDVPEETIDKRSAVRMVSKDILLMVNQNAQIIYVRVATENGIIPTRGVLEDINQGGLCFRMPGHSLLKNQSIKIRVMLGKRLFTSNAQVRWVNKDKVGLQYVNPAPEDVNFLAELYSAKILNRV